MSDKEIGEALLKLNPVPQAEADDRQIERILNGDRRRVKRLTWIAVGLWATAAAGTLTLFVIGGLVFPAIAKMLQELGEHGLDQPDTPFLMLAKLTAVNIVLGSLSFLLLVFAGLATVLLVFRSRRVTLGQINANLLQISKQLKQLQLPGTESGGATP